MLNSYKKTVLIFATALIMQTTMGMDIGHHSRPSAQTSYEMPEPTPGTSYTWQHTLQTDNNNLHTITTQRVHQPTWKDQFNNQFAAVAAQTVALVLQKIIISGGYMAYNYVFPNKEELEVQKILTQQSQNAQSEAILNLQKQALEQLKLAKEINLEAKKLVASDPDSEECKMALEQHANALALAKALLTDFNAKRAAFLTEINTAQTA